MVRDVTIDCKMKRSVGPSRCSSSSRAARCAHGRRRRTRACATSERNVKDVKAGFRWDPAMSRWIRDDKMVGFDAPVEIQPKSGAAYTVWPVMHTDLTEYGLTSYPPSKASEMQKDGWVLLDVRVDGNYNFEHIKDSVSIPLYRPVQGRSLFDNAKRLAMASMAMKATERDPEFAKNVVTELGKDAKIMLVCDIGGTLSTKVEVAHKKKDYEVKDPERAFGRESRSLKAAHALLMEGCKNLAHLEGGLQQWRHQGFPVV